MRHWRSHWENGFRFAHTIAHEISAATRWRCAGALAPRPENSSTVQHTLALLHDEDTFFIEHTIRDFYQIKEIEE